MKYSFMSFSTPDADLAEMLEIARHYGYDGIEPRLDVKHAHGIEVETTVAQRAKIAKQMSNSKIKLSCLATSLSYADSAKNDEMIWQTHVRIDLAGDLNVPVIRVFGGLIPEGTEREQAVENLVKALKKVADHAGERDVKICVETHDDWRDPVHLADVMRQVNHSAIRINWDIMHPLRIGKDIRGSFVTLRDWISHVHVHDGIIGEKVHFVPIGTGEIDHRTAIKLLKSAAYQGYISGEWINWEDYKIHLPREIATLKKYETEA